MAMIQCPECGNEVSDKAKKCIHCGKILIEEPKRFCTECGKEVDMNATECPHCGCPIEEEKVAVPKKPKKNLRKIIIPIAIILIIAIIGIFVVNYVKTSLNEDEQLAYQNILEMQSMMRDPDSFKLYDELFLLRHYDDSGNVEYTYTIFKYGGANGYGAITTDEAIFKDGEFIMNYADEPDEDDADYIEQLGTQLDLQLYILFGSEDDSGWERVDLDIEKIKAKMGLE